MTVPPCREALLSCVDKKVSKETTRGEALTGFSVVTLAVSFPFTPKIAALSSGLLSRHPCRFLVPCRLLVACAFAISANSHAGGGILYKSTLDDVQIGCPLLVAIVFLWLVPDNIPPRCGSATSLSFY